MPQEPTRPPMGPLVLAVVLAATAGFVDARVYLHVTPVFVANMSGNLVHMGLFLGRSHWTEAAGSATALVSFVGGVMAATMHHDRLVRTGRPARPTSTLAVEAALVAVLPVLIATIDGSFRPRVPPITYPVLVIGAFAMGMQTVALGRVGSTAVSTTYGSGSIVRIGEKAVLALRGGDPTTEHRRGTALVVLVSVVVGYVGGAAVGAALGRSPWLLLVPALALGAAAVTTRTFSADPTSVG